jgi:putative esterase
MFTLIGTSFSAGRSDRFAAPFVISLGPGISDHPLTGRVFLLVSRQSDGEPRLADTSAWYNNTPDSPDPEPLMFAKDAGQVAAGSSVYITAQDVGYPVASVRSIPAGDYTVQAVFNVYTRFARADGRVLWAHKDHGEGQHTFLSPGNLVSEPQRVHFDPAHPRRTRLRLTRVLPPIEPRPDTEFVKHLHVTSRLASEFWGQDMEVGITIALPAGYAQHPERRYPVVFHQGHFDEGAVFSRLEPSTNVQGQAGLRDWTERNKAFIDAWQTGGVPQLIVVSMQHPTPFYDTSYFVNSPNTGPWADVFIHEVIPYVDAHFRTIAQPYARVVAGLSSGGGISAYLQVHFPRQLGGAWIFAPDPVDFRDFYTVNLYTDKNAYREPGHEWDTAPPRYTYRSTKGQSLQSIQRQTQLFDVLGSHERSGEWMDNYDALYGPIGDDGYPVPVWNHRTGDINPEVVAYWRSHGSDLRVYLEDNWARIAPDLDGKLHFAVGEMDNYFLNGGLYLLEEYLRRASSPTISANFKYGRPMVGHSFDGVGYDPFPAALLQDIAAHIAKRAPPDADSSWYGR